MNASPDPVEVSDFFFKQIRRIQISSHHYGPNYSHLLAVSNKYGLVFIGTPTDFIVLSTEEIQKNNSVDQTELETSDFTCNKIALSSPPTHLYTSPSGINLAVICIENDIPFLFLYDIKNYFVQTHNWSFFKKIPLSSSNNVTVTDFSFSPLIDEIIAVCLDSGELLILEFNSVNYKFTQLKDIKFDFQDGGHIPFCLSWSPKGKQLAVGCYGGYIVQYKPDFKFVKAINPFHIYQVQSNIKISNLLWISNYVFLASYFCASNMDKRIGILQITTSKEGSITVIDFEDICYSGNIIRNPFYYIIHIPDWNLVICASNNAVEVGTLSYKNNIWKQWVLEDSGRAELPLLGNNEVFPVGMALDVTCTKSFVVSESVALPPMPLLYIMTNNGLLCTFYAVNKLNNYSVITHQSELLELIKKQNSTIASQVIDLKISTANLHSSSSACTLQPSVCIHSKVEIPSVKQNALKTTAASQSCLSTSMVNSISTKCNSYNKCVPSEKTLPPRPVACSNIVTVSKSEACLISSTDNTNTSTNSSVKNSILNFNESNLKEVKIITQNSHPLKSDIFPFESLYKNISEEIISFQKELTKFKLENQKDYSKIGSKHEIGDLKNNVQKVEICINKLQSTIANINGSLNRLKNKSLHSFALLAEIRARFHRLKDSKYRNLLLKRSLDLNSQHQMEGIRKMLHYLECQLEAVNHHLDENWGQFHASRSQKFPLYLSFHEIMYCTLLNNEEVIAQLDIEVDRLLQKVKIYQSSKLLDKQEFNDTALTKKLINLNLKHNITKSFSENHVTEKLEKFAQSLLSRNEIPLRTVPNHKISHLKFFKNESECNSDDLDFIKVGISDNEKETNCKLNVNVQRGLSHNQYFKGEKSELSTVFTEKKFTPSSDVLGLLIERNSISTQLALEESKSKSSFLEFPPFAVLTSQTDCDNLFLTQNSSIISDLTQEFNTISNTPISSLSNDVVNVSPNYCQSNQLLNSIFLNSESKSLTESQEDFSENVKPTESLISNIKNMSEADNISETKVNSKLTDPDTTGNYNVISSSIKAYENSDNASNNFETESSYFNGNNNTSSVVNGDILSKQSDSFLTKNKISENLGSGINVYRTTENVIENISINLKLEICPENNSYVDISNDTPKSVSFIDKDNIPISSISPLSATTILKSTSSENPVLTSTSSTKYIAGSSSDSVHDVFTPDNKLSTLDINSTVKEDDNINMLDTGSQGLGNKPEEQISSPNIFSNAFSSNEQNNEKSFGLSPSSFSFSGNFSQAGFNSSKSADDMFNSSASFISTTKFPSLETKVPCTRSSIFGGSPVFGGTPTFGDLPAFGGTPTFGGSSLTFGSVPTFGGSPTFGSSSIFGGGPTFGSSFGNNANVANFGSLSNNSNVPTFGSIAESGNGNQPMFGSFSTLNQENTFQSSIFGNTSSFSNNADSFKGTSFSQWR